MFNNDLYQRMKTHPVWWEFKNKQVTTDFALIYSTGAGGNFIASSLYNPEYVTEKNEYFSEAKWFSPEDKLTDLITRTDEEYLNFIYDCSVSQQLDLNEKILLGHLHPVVSDDIYTCRIEEYLWINNSKDTAWFTDVLCFIKFFLTNEYNAKFSNIISVLESFADLPAVSVGNFLKTRSVINSILIKYKIESTSVIVFKYNAYLIKNNIAPSPENFELFLKVQLNDFLIHVRKFPGFAHVNPKNSSEFDYFKDKVKYHFSVNYIDLFKDKLIPFNSKINQIDILDLDNYYRKNYELVESISELLGPEYQELLKTRYKPDEKILEKRQRTASVKQISSENFDVLEGLNVLELGSFEGWFTEEILKSANSVTCLEYNQHSCEILKEKFKDAATVIQGDFHKDLKDLGKFDAVVVYGVLYHSCSPLKVLEDIVNYNDPEIVLLEVFQDLENLQSAPIYLTEEINIQGNRFSKEKTCGISVGLSSSVCQTAMKNLGYTLTRVNTFRNPFDLSHPFKKNAVYFTFKKPEENIL